MAIRMARVDDAEQIRAIYAPIVEKTTISFEWEPPGAEEMRSRIAETLVSYPWLVSEESQEILGYAYAGLHRSRKAYEWSVETSVYVRGDVRRRGFGRSLYVVLSSLLALQGYYNAYAGIALPNPASVALHESVGFRPIGVYREVGFKKGRWHDVGWWQLELQPKAGGPVRPLSLLEAQSKTGWEAASKTAIPG